MSVNAPLFIDAGFVEDEGLNRDFTPATESDSPLIRLLDEEGYADPDKWPKCQTQENYARLVVARRKGWLVYYD